MRAPLNGVLYNARTIKWCFVYCANFRLEVLGKDGEDMSWEADAPDLPALLIGGKGP